MKTNEEVQQPVAAPAMERTVEGAIRHMKTLTDQFDPSWDQWDNKTYERIASRFGILLVKETGNSVAAMTVLAMVLKLAAERGVEFLDAGLEGVEKC